MPATIVQRNKKRLKKVKVDTVSIDIIESALRNARFEMDTVLFRTAMSPGIREQHDEFPMIANVDGKMVVGQFGSFIWGFMEGYEGTIEEGDIFLTNDPYSVRGSISHANDWLMLMPIYRAGRLIAWSAMFGHMTDVGGKVPGSLPTDARTIYEEGVTVPPVKIYKKGVLNDDVLKIMLHNCRLPHWNLSDFNAITAALRTAATRCVEISERFGDDVFYSAMDEMLERNKRAMRELIKRTVPEKKQHFEDYICDDGLNMGPYKIACTMWREGDKCIFDFQGTDPQSISSINFLLNEEMFKMFAGVYMIMVFDPQILFNDGFYDLMEVRIPAGTLLKPLKPAALSCRTHALGRIFDILGGLLGQGNPQFMCAAGFSDSPHFMYSGHDKNGDWYQLYQITFGGIPGKPFGDGPDGHSLWPAFTNVPNEFLESYFPLRIDIYETIADTGGPGKNRGGNGLRIGYRFLEPGEISIHDDRWLTYPWGVNGGLPGARSKKTLVRTDGSEELLHSKLDHIKVEAGDLLLSDTWGGGGCGDPLEREPEKVKFDVDAGLVTSAGARRYGVVLNAQGAVDTAATIALRGKMASARGPVKLFDRGFDSIEELKSRCFAETGLQPPTQPQFTKWALKAATATKGKAGMSDQYTNVGYGGISDGLGTKPAVLVVDFQVAFTDPKFPLGGLPMIHAATEKTAELLKVARQKNVPIASCYTAYGSVADMPRWKVKAVRDDFIYGHPCTAMDPRIVEPSDFVFCKNAPSIFFLTPLITFLAKHQVDTVIITGCTTSGCVRASIIDAFSFGFRIGVPEDCCGDADRGPHEDNLRDCARRYCEVTDLKSTKKYLQGL